MIPKIILMHSGERVIAMLGEVTDEDGKGVGIIARCPYILSMMPAGDSPDGNSTQFNVNFTKWIPFSSDDQFKIPYNSVVAIGEVEPGILDAYIGKFGDKLNDDNTLQPSDSSDTAEDAGVSDIRD
jgi:hypothetical protein